MVLRAAVLLLLLTGCGLTEAAHLLRDATSPASELRDGVEESVETIAGERVRLYRPSNADADTPVLLLVAGAVEDGIDEPRLVALARALTRRGLIVATPDLQSLRAFRIDPDDPARIAKVLNALPTNRPVSLAGISIGGSYCLVAATRPEVRDRIPCVLSFGGYFDLERLLELWLTAPRPAGEGMMDPLGEGRRAVLKANRDRVPPALYREAMASNDPLTKAQAREALSRLAADFNALSPARRRPPPTARIFLLHGAEDPIVPTRDARDTAQWYRKFVPVRLLVTDLFSHVPGEGRTPGLVESLPLLRFVAAFLSAARA